MWLDCTDVYECVLRVRVNLSALDAKKINIGLVKLDCMFILVENKAQEIIVSNKYYINFVCFNLNTLIIYPYLLGILVI